MIDAKLLSALQGQLIFDEGRRNKQYKDVLGNDTIGIGHLVRPQDRELIKDGMVSDDQINKWFVEDIQEVYDSLTKSLLTAKWFTNLSIKRKAVIMGMVFNLGFPGFCRFIKLIAALNNGNFKNASIEILNSEAARTLPVRYRRYSDDMLMG